MSLTDADVRSEYFNTTDTSRRSSRVSTNTSRRSSRISIIRRNSMILIQEFHEENEILTYEESEVRLIILGFISCLALLTCGTAFMCITRRISGYYQDPIVLDYKGKQSVGFPHPKLLIMDDSGNYLIYSPLFNTLEKLPGLNRVPKGFKNPDTDNAFLIYKIFSVEYKNNLYFIYADKTRNVIKYDLDAQTHRIIWKSPSIHLHNGECSGIQVGKYFWIILGEKDIFSQSFNLRPQLKSSIWSLEKGRWFEGPPMLGVPRINKQQARFGDYCIVSVGLNTAYLLIGT